MALRFRDPVAVKHPSEQGFQIVSRNAAGVMARNGWVEDKSPEAKAAVAKATRTAVAADTPTPTTPATTPAVPKESKS